MRIRDERETEWQEKPANSPCGPEFELETKYLMGTLKNHGKNTAYIYCVTKK